MRIVRPLRVLSLLSILTVALSCEGGLPTTTGGPPGGSGSGLTVQVADDLFSPAAITASAGETITWAWVGANQHNVTFADSTIGNSVTQSSGSFQVSFTNAGTYVYGCTVHPGMSGTVTIR